MDLIEIGVGSCDISFMFILGGILEDGNKLIWDWVVVGVFNGVIFIVNECVFRFILRLVV